MNELIKAVLDYSYKNQVSHIASALSMLTYIDVLFTNKFVTLDDGIVLGKPFGSQAYYVLWKQLGYLDDIDKLNVGVKHDEVMFVNYSEETMGNALGVSAGIAMTTDQRIWVNISDAALQMGNTLEAIQFIGHNRLKNVFLTVDYNNAQVTGNISDILEVWPVKQFFRENGWYVQEVDGHDPTALNKTFSNLVSTNPNVVFCNTKKGYGVRSIQNDPKKWHYRQIESSAQLQELLNEIHTT